MMDIFLLMIERVGIFLILASHSLLLIMFRLRLMILVFMMAGFIWLLFLEYLGIQTERLSGLIPVNSPHRL